MAKFWSVNWIGSWGLWSLGRWRDERERKGGAGGERGRGRGRGVGGGGCGGVGDGRGRGNQHFQYQQHHQQYPQFYHQEQQGQFRNPWKGDQLAQGPNSGHGGATAADGSSSSSRLSKNALSSKFGSCHWYTRCVLCTGNKLQMVNTYSFYDQHGQPNKDPSARKKEAR